MNNKKKTTVYIFLYSSSFKKYSNTYYYQSKILFWYYKQWILNKCFNNTFNKIYKYNITYIIEIEKNTSNYSLFFSLCNTECNYTYILRIVII